jgi:hypothetical protein
VTLSLPRRARSTLLDVPDPEIVARNGAASQDHLRLTALLGAGRIALGGAFLAFPVTSVRTLGVDTASAGRMAWLARMAAARDIALGLGVLGTVATRRGRAAALAVTALVDAVDAAVIAAAASERRVDRLRGYAMAAGAAAVAVGGLVTAADVARRRG